MSALQIVINLIAYGIFSFGSLLFWPSRRNVVAWLAFPFFVVGYLIPLLSFPYQEWATPAAINLLTLLNLLGAVGMVMGIAIGNALAIPKARTVARLLDSGNGSSVISERRLLTVMLVGCTLMTFCYAWMGMVPMFAEDPFLAKFFRAPYKDKYDQIAIIYRFSQVLVVTSLPLAVAIVVERRPKALLLAGTWAIVLIALSLVRGSVLSGTLILVAAWCSRSTKRMFWFLLITTTLYCVGSSAFVLLGLIVVDDFNPWLEIERGAPDIRDHLQFVTAFDPSEQLTYGLTFIGGLIPGNFYFNPAVFTLSVANDTTDVTTIASGGFRLPPSVAGYMAFSWVGAMLVPMIAGVFTGYFTKVLRRLRIRGLSEHVAFLLWFTVYASFWITFYSMTYGGVIAIFVMAYISFNPRKLAQFVSRRRPRAASSPKPPLLSRQGTP